MSEELKPCPFCGGDAKFVQVEGRYPHRVMCTRCEATSGGSAYKNDAYNRAMWNLRTETKGAPPMTDPNAPAYPVADFQRQDGEVHWGSSGLTKREAMAMHIAGHIDIGAPEENARRAVAEADALLAELARTRG